MFTVSKIFNFEAAHQLNLPYESKCNTEHGHSYRVELILRGSTINEQGMLVDYNRMQPFSEYINTYMDHQNLNEVLPYATTAENIAKHLYTIAWSLWHDVAITVRVSETAKTWASYTQSE